MTRYHTGQEQSPVVGGGVGLALCKRLVEAQNGWFRPTVAKELAPPLRWACRLAPAASKRTGVAKESRATILYVVDNPSNVLVMRHIVKEIEGVELLVAANARNGIELARAVRPTVILLDINLPEMDGFEVLGVLRTHSETARIPTLALTANAMLREVERGKEAGFARYLTKPINVPEFIEALREALRIVKPGAADRSAELDPGAVALRTLQHRHAFDASGVRSNSLRAPRRAKLVSTLACGRLPTLRLPSRGRLFAAGGACILR